MNGTNGLPPDKIAFSPENILSIFCKLNREKAFGDNLEIREKTLPGFFYRETILPFGIPFDRCLRDRNQ